METGGSSLYFNYSGECAGVYVRGVGKGRFSVAGRRND